MSADVPQMLDSSALRIQELAYGLKVRDVMTTKIFALSRNCTMRDVQSEGGDRPLQFIRKSV